MNKAKSGQMLFNQLTQTNPHHVGYYETKFVPDKAHDACHALKYYSMNLKGILVKSLLFSDR